MLDDDGRVCNQRPEIVRLESGVSLEVLEEGLLVCVVIWICLEVSNAIIAVNKSMKKLTRLLYPKQLLPSPLPPSTRRAMTLLASPSPVQLQGIAIGHAQVAGDSVDGHGQLSRR